MSAHEASAGKRLASMADGLIGTPFRLGGRSPQSGLDCIGLIHASLASMGRKPLAPTGYGLRSLSIAGHLPLIEANGFAPATGPIAPGDIELCQPGPAQHHLVIWSSNADFIHAHAGLRQVTRTPAPLPWTSLGRWRLQEKDH